VFDVVVCDVVCGGSRDGVVGSGMVEWLILCCLGVLVMDGLTDWWTDGRMDGQTDIGGCRVAFVTEKSIFFLRC